MLCGAVLLKPGCVAHVPLAAGFAAFFMDIRFIRWNQITNGRGFDLFAPIAGQNRRYSQHCLTVGIEIAINMFGLSF